MLPVQHRLRRAGDFALVHREGRCWSNRLLVLCKRANGLETSRVGFSVGRRTGGAALRNRVKRRLREAMRARLGLLRQGWDIVVIARRGMATADYPTTEGALTDLLLRAGLVASPDGVCPERAG